MTTKIHAAARASGDKWIEVRKKKFPTLNPGAWDQEASFLSMGYLEGAWWVIRQIESGVADGKSLTDVLDDLNKVEESQGGHRR